MILDSSRPHVMHVITMLELGGAQQNTLHTVRHLDRARFRVSLVTGVGGQLDGEARTIAGAGVHFEPNLVREVRPLRDLRALRSLAALFRRERPDVVHTHSSKAGVLGRWAAALAGVKVVVHSVHGFGFTPGQSPVVRGLFLGAEHLTSRVTDHFICVSRSNLAEGVRRGLFRRDRATLVRSGFDLAAFTTGARDRAGLRRELGFAADAVVVATVSCLKPQKDPATLAGVIARVLEHHPETRFLVAGDGALRADLEARLAAARAGHAVRLLGWRDDIPRLLRAADLLLHTSRWEGLPRVLPQAMAAGLPVVATAVDGAPEVVRDGDTGFLAAPRDVDALAAAVSRLVAEPALRHRLGARAASRVAEFDVARLVPAQQDLYDRLLAASRQEETR